MEPCQRSNESLQLQPATDLYVGAALPPLKKTDICMSLRMITDVHECFVEWGARHRSADYACDLHFWQDAVPCSHQYTRHISVAQISI